MKPVYIDEDGKKYTIGVSIKKKVYHICVAEPGLVTEYRPHPILPHMYERELAVEMLQAYAERRKLKQVMVNEM